MRWTRSLRRAVLVAAVAVGVLGAGTASAGWLPPAPLAPPSDNHFVGSPSVAVARDGTALVAFQHFDGSNTRAAVVERGPGGGFGAVRDLSPAGKNSFSPVVAVDRQGNATIAWLNVPDLSIQTRSRPAGGDWGTTTTFGAGSVFSGPGLAVGDNGAAVVAWNQSLAFPVVQVQAAVRPSAGQPFSAELPVSANAGNGMCGFPRVAMDAAGDVAVIWTRRTSGGGDYHVESAVKAAGANAFDPWETRSGLTGNSDCNTDIQMTPGGRVLAMWDFFDNVNPKYVAYADRTTPFASGAWSSAKLSVPTDTSSRPAFALDEAGDAAATWLSNGQLLSAVRTGLGGFSPPKPLSGVSATEAQAVAASPNGDAIVAFVGMSNGIDAIFAARRQAGAPFGDATPVAVTPPGGATVFLSSPDIALDDQGNAFAVWQRQVFGVSSSTAEVAAFDPVPPAITAANVPATATAGAAVAMSAAATDRMSGAALHFDFGDNAGADGGSVQHIYANPGAYTVTVTATDGAGNRSGTTRSIQVASNDKDGDGVPAGLDCNDNNPKIHPGAREIRGNKVDEDCNGRAEGYLRVRATVTLSWDRLFNGTTRINALLVQDLARRDRIGLSCRGSGCSRKAKRTIRVRKRGRMLLSKYVRGMTLRPGARLTIRITHSGQIGRIYTYTMISHKDPRKSTRCLRPGKKKATRC